MKMSYLRYVCLFTCSGVHILCFVFVLCFFVYPMVPISLDYTFMIVSVVLSNV